MPRSTEKLDPSLTASALAGAAASLPADPLSLDEDPDDPFYYGWRDRWETAADGTSVWRQVPLTYADLLDPQLGDFVAENTIHHQLRGDLFSLLQRRFADDPGVAVWSDLKISFRIPGLTTGPGPDVCLVEGVDDRALRRRSFRHGKEPGKVRMVIEVVSEKSIQKDYRDILVIYERLGVEEYLAIRPLGLYVNGPFELRGWRRHPKTGRLLPFHPDEQGRYRLETAGVALGTGDEGWGLEVWDGETGELLRPLSEEVAWQAERLEQESEKAEMAEARAEQAEAARQEAEAAWQEAEARHRESVAELERLRAQLRERGDG